MIGCLYRLEHVIRLTHLKFKTYIKVINVVSHICYTENVRYLDCRKCHLVNRGNYREEYSASLTIHLLL